MSAAPALLVCGSLTIDNVRTADGTLLPRRAGGNVIFAALGARLWSSSIGLVSRAGRDYPREALTRMRGLGFDLAGIARIDAPHGMNVAFSYAADGSRVRVFPPDIMAAIPQPDRARFTDYTAAGLGARFATWLAFSPTDADIPAGWVRGARAAHLAAMPVQRHQSLVGALTGMRVQIDSPWYDERTPGQDFHTKLLPGIDLLLPSEADLLLWRPQRPPLETAAALARQTRQRVLVKQGSEGAVLLDRDGELECRWPALPVPVIDLTGAGDAFCGGFLAGFDASGDVEHAGACGTVSASFAIGGVGTDGLLAIDRAEASRRLDWVMDRVEAKGLRT